MASDGLYFLNEHIIKCNALQGIALDLTELFKSKNLIILKALQCIDVPLWRLECGTSVKGEHGLLACRGKHHTNLLRAGFELRSLGSQAGMLPIEPSLLVNSS